MKFFPRLAAEFFFVKNGGLTFICCVIGQNMRHNAPMLWSLNKNYAPVLPIILYFLI